jgi:hypothetical protein
MDFGKSHERELSLGVKYIQLKGVNYVQSTSGGMEYSYHETAKAMDNRGGRKRGNIYSQCNERLNANHHTDVDKTGNSRNLGQRGWSLDPDPSAMRPQT